MTNYFPFQYSFVKKKKRIRATTMSSFLNSKEEYLYYSWFFLFCSREVIPIRITERFISFNCFGCWVYRNFFNASRFGEIKLLFAMLMSWVLCLFVDGYSPGCVLFRANQNSFMFIYIYIYFFASRKIKKKIRKEEQKSKYGKLVLYNFVLTV